jgi:addiction module HigA family antidote
MSTSATTLRQEAGQPARPAVGCLLPVGQQLVARIIRERGLTVQALAAALGMSRKHLSQVIHGRAPISADNLDRLARTIGISPELLSALVARRRGEWREIRPGYVNMIESHGDLTEPMEWDID